MFLVEKEDGLYRLKTPLCKVRDLSADEFIKYINKSYNKSVFIFSDRTIKELLLDVKKNKSTFDEKLKSIVLLDEIDMMANTFTSELNVPIEGSKKIVKIANYVEIVRDAVNGVLQPIADVEL